MLPVKPGNVSSWVQPPLKQGSHLGENSPVGHRQKDHTRVGLSESQAPGQRSLPREAGVHQRQHFPNFVKGDCALE
jgi:hypothetical protein